MDIWKSHVQQGEGEYSDADPNAELKQMDEQLHRPFANRFTMTILIVVAAFKRLREA